MFCPRRLRAPQNLRVPRTLHVPRTFVCFRCRGGSLCFNGPSPCPSPVFVGLRLWSVACGEKQVNQANRLVLTIVWDSLILSGRRAWTRGEHCTFLASSAECVCRFAFVHLRCGLAYPGPLQHPFPTRPNLFDTQLPPSQARHNAARALLRRPGVKSVKFLSKSHPAGSACKIMIMFADPWQPLNLVRT